MAATILLGLLRKTCLFPLDLDLRDPQVEKRCGHSVMMEKQLFPFHTLPCSNALQKINALLVRKVQV